MVRCSGQGAGYLSGVSVEEFSARFRPDPRSLSDVRRFLRTALGPLGTDAGRTDLADDLLIAGHELAANAVLHARTEFTVRVLVEATRIRVEVVDGNTRMPQPCLTPVGATSGRGLAIVDGTGLDWGAERHGFGKTVWVEARLKADRKG